MATLKGIKSSIQPTLMQQLIQALLEQQHLLQWQTTLEQWLIPGVDHILGDT